MYNVVNVARPGRHIREIYCGEAAVKAVNSRIQCNKEVRR